MMEHDIKHHTDQLKALEPKPAQGDASMKGMKEMSHNGSDHHAHMAADFWKRFWISLVLTIPILILSPLLQTLVGLRDAIRFPDDIYILLFSHPRSFDTADGRSSKALSMKSNLGNLE